MASASTTLITDATTMITNGPSTLTAANAASGTFTPSSGVQSGAPVDYVGMLQEYKDTLKSIKLLLTNLQGVTDAGDPNLTYIQNDLLTFS